MCSITLKRTILWVIGLCAPAVQLSLHAANETNRFTALNEAVPDGNAAGLSDVRNVSSSISQLSAVRVSVRISGEFNGDLYGYVRHITPAATNFCVLLNRPGRTTSDPFGYDDMGFDITFDDSAANGDIHNYRSILMPALGTPLTGTWQPDGRNINPATVLASTPRTTSLSSFINSPASGEWTLFLADIESGGTNMLVSWGLEFTGTASSPPVNWTTPADIVYGTALGPAQLSASSPVAGTFTYNPPSGTILNAGSRQLSVTFVPTDSASYSSVTTNVTINVLKKSLTITANNAGKVYGAVLPALTANYAGFVNGDIPASLDSPVMLSTSATASSPVGTYPISAAAAADANYQITFVNGTLTVTQAPLNISGANQTKVYGAPVPPLTVNYSGFVNGDTAANLDAPVAVTTTATASSSVGSYPITVSGASDSNYQITFTPGALNVTRAPLTITAANQTKVYGAPVPPLTINYSGFVNGDTPANLDTPAAATTTATVSSSVGSYPITVSGASDSNYQITFTPGALNVTRAPLTITAANQTKVYGAPVPPLTVNYSGFVNSDTAANLDTPAAVTTTATASSSVGSYPITVSGASDVNYQIAFAPGMLNISPAALTITAANTSTVYGAPLPAFSANYTGLVNGDSAASLDSPVVFTTTASPGSNVGSYPIRPAGAADANYAISFVDGTLLITPARSTASLISSANPARPGQSVTFTFRATPVAPSVAMPVGEVLFKVDGGSTSVPLVDGTAALSSSTLSLGTHAVVAEYAGTANWIGTTNRVTPDQVVNTPPVAGTDTIQRYPRNRAKVQIAILLGNDSDADGHPITFAAVNSVSLNGGTVTRDGDWIYYIPPAGFTNVDSFTYTISDSRQTATGTVNIAVSSSELPSPNLTIAPAGNGSFRIRFDAVPELTYDIEYTESPGSTPWRLLGSRTASEMGIIEIVDTPPPGSVSRFYRSVLP